MRIRGQLIKKCIIYILFFKHETTKRMHAKEAKEIEITSWLVNMCNLYP